MEGYAAFAEKYHESKMSAGFYKYICCFRWKKRDGAIGSWMEAFLKEVLPSIMNSSTFLE